MNKKVKSSGYLFSVYSPDSDTDEVSVMEPVQQQNHDLILYNDDFNTFDWVIESLMKICHHDSIQAEQCAHLVHHVGKCGIKRGSVKELRPLCEALLDRGLSATIE
jgi:ATP-dependent Clp protease adaptor protein ClpS